MARANSIPPSIAAAVAVLLAAGAAAATGPVTLDYRVFPGLAHMDGHWAALFVAADGKVYMGLAYHGGDGHLVMYDPATDRVQDPGPLTQLCGEQALGAGPQAKIHFKFGEGRDGRIYFATHYGLDFDFARYATRIGYPGSHFMAFDPKTGRLEDFGVGPRFQGMVSGNYDPVFNRIYGITDPEGHFVYFDVAKRRFSDKGRINNWESLCRFLAIDGSSNVYGSYGHGQVFRYDPRTDEVRDLSIRLPIRPKGISLGRDYNKSETAWRAVVWDGETHRFYGLEESASALFSFDPAAGRDGEVVPLGQLAIPGMAQSREVPYATLSLTLGHDRKLYYAAAGREFDYGGSAGPAASHLLTYDLRSGRIEDLGEMRLADGRRVLGTNSAHTAPDGTIYFGGAIEVQPEPGKPMESGGKIGDVDYRIALLIYHPHR